RDLERLSPCVPAGSTVVAHNGVGDAFRPAGAAEVDAFRKAHGIDRPYVLMVGDRAGYEGYKNGLLLFHALGLMEGAADEVMVLCVGGQPEIEPTFAVLAPGVPVVRLSLSDEDLRLAYAGARALVYPSRYEGFGMPIVEAMACGCPVITCANSSIVEVAGDAALFVGENDAPALADRLREVADPERRAELVRRGLEQAARFSFTAMAEILAQACTGTVDRIKAGSLPVPGPQWQETKELLAEAQRFRIEEAIRMKRAAEATVPEEPEPLVVPDPAVLERLAQCEQELVRVNEVATSIQNSPFWRLRNLTVTALRTAGLRQRH
ncbi:glycosyltransferase, partial [Azospirillum formosense]